MGLERLAPLGDEGSEPSPRARQKTPTQAWGIPDDQSDPHDPSQRRSKKAAKQRPRKTWPTPQERVERAEAKDAARAKEIAADPTGYARQVCLQLLEIGPRTRSELATALAKKGVPEEASAEVLGRFAEVGIIDDALFASLWVSSRHRGRGLAGRALSQELRRKGVDDETIKDAVGELEPEQEEQTARELVRRKLASTRRLPADARIRRLAGMLARKGYSGGLAFRVVKEELEAEGTDLRGLTLDTDQLSALE